MEDFSSIKWSTEKWNDYIEQQATYRETVFLTTPGLRDLISYSRRESRDAEGYNGREILELIQNADDAASDCELARYSSPKPLIKFVLKNGYLFVANTGVPFIEKGIESILIGDDSPKTGRRLIGNKGLGFRSLKNIAKSIIILSGNLEIGFSKSSAEMWLNSISAKKEEYKNAIETEYINTGIKPIPTFAIPIIFKHKNIEDQEINLIYKECKELREQNFDTVIGMKLIDSDEIYEEIKRQIEEVNSYTIIFLNKITKIEREIDGVPDCVEVKVIEKASDYYKLLTEEDKEWTVFPKYGTISKEELGGSKDVNYELKIAVPKDSTSLGYIYTYLKTQIKFPFPVLAHASFELTPDRQHLVPKLPNKIISKKLAEKLTSVAEKYTSKEKPWQAFSLITPTSEIDKTLQDLGFLDVLLEYVKKSEIIPVRNEKFFVASKCKTIKGPFNEVLNSKEFYDICLWTNDQNINDQIENLGVNELDKNELTSRINTITVNIDLKRRAKLICLLSKWYQFQKLPNLFIDNEGKIITTDSTLMLSPENKIIDLPEWVPQRFVNNELVKLLLLEFNITNNRQLTHSLKDFDLHEYGREPLIRSIVSKTTELITANPTDVYDFRKQMVRALWMLYTQQDDDTPIKDQSIILPTRTGQFKQSVELYIGMDYGGEWSDLVEALYSFDKSTFLASPKDLDLEKGLKSNRFLLWLGVNEKPRKEIGKPLQYRDREYKEFVLLNLEYPVTFEELTIDHKSEISSNMLNILSITKFDRIEQIIQNAEPKAIIAWLAFDTRVSELITHGDKNAEVDYRISYKHKSRMRPNQIIESYVKWIFHYYEWLPTISGKKSKPINCLLINNELEGLFDKPNINIDDQFFKTLDLNRENIKDALKNAGVARTASDLSWTDIYDLLLKLPKIDEEGKYAKTIYHSALSKKEDEEPNGEKYNEFLSKGVLLAECDSKKGYFRINDIYYSDMQIPISLAKNYPILELERGRGVNIIKAIFGVKPFEFSNAVEITNFDLNPSSKFLEDAFENLKPIVYAIRLDLDKQKSISKLRDYKIRLCREVRYKITIGDEKIEELTDNEYLPMKNITYILTNSTFSDYQYPIKDINISGIIGEIFSNIFRVDVTEKVQIIAGCMENIEKINQLLDRYTGGNGIKSLSKARDLLGKVPDEESIYQYDVNTKRKSDEKPDITPPKETPQPPSTPLPPLPDSNVELESIDRVGSVSPNVPKKVISQIVKVSTGTKREPRYSKTNPDRAQNISIEIEHKYDRFPYDVSGKRGEEGYGCDILSFRSDEDRENFKNSELEGAKNFDLVLRFIEVKGGSSHGSNLLGGNELKSARIYKNRFFIYRIYENPDELGTVEFFELQDPMSAIEALEPLYRMNVHNTGKTVFYNVTIVLPNKIE